MGRGRRGEFEDFGDTYQRTIREIPRWTSPAKYIYLSVVHTGKHRRKKVDRITAPSRSNITQS